MSLFWGVKGVFDITAKINEKYLKMTKNIVFMGTPEFSVPCLETLIQSEYDVVAVYTQPDRKAGRGLKMIASPVKEKSLDNGIRVLQPETLREEQEYEKLKKMEAAKNKKSDESEQ